jgi:hypothetical protein
MPIPRRTTTRRLSESTRRKLEVTSAMAWESLVDTHVEQATQFVSLLAEFTPVQESLPRYLREMDLYETMVAAIRSRVLMRVEDEGHETADAAALRIEPPAAVADGDEGEGWNLLRQPGRVVRGVLQRQRRNDEMERIVQLAIARAEESIIRTHVENAIGFAALLEDQMPLDRAVQQYLGAVGLAGGRAQAVFQRTMARLADVHLPR